MKFFALGSDCGGSLLAASFGFGESAVLVWIERRLRKIARSVHGNYGFVVGFVMGLRVHTKKSYWITKFVCSLLEDPGSRSVAVQACTTRSRSPGIPMVSGGS